MRHFNIYVSSRILSVGRCCVALTSSDWVQIEDRKCNRCGRRYYRRMSVEVRRRKVYYIGLYMMRFRLVDLHSNVAIELSSVVSWGFTARCVWQWMLQQTDVEMAAVGLASDNRWYSLIITVSSFNCCTAGRHRFVPRRRWITTFTRCIRQLLSMATAAETAL